MVAVAEAYAACERDAREHYENFPVASFLLPPRMRPHVAAVYAFARAADDFADEGELAPETRERLLAGWLDRLHAAARGESDGPAPAPGEPDDAVAIFVALGASIRTLNLPVTLFEDLISAFRQDVTLTRYDTWPQLLDYCRRSANPVGRLVLRVAGHDDPALDARSDAICTGLQLANFWQDIAVDRARGRTYLPADLIAGHGSVAAALKEAVSRTRLLFAAGRPLCDAVQGRLRYELRATWLGGVRILDRVEATGCDPDAPRPKLTAADAPWFAWRMLTW